MTSRDILRALRGPLEDFVNEMVVQMELLAGEAGTPQPDSSGTLMYETDDGTQYGVISIGMTEPPLLPAITIMVNTELYGKVGNEFKQVFRYSQESSTSGGAVTVIKLGANDVDQYSDASPYHPLRKYRGEVVRSH